MTVALEFQGHLMIRAAALAGHDGSVALLCGDPEAGTSTLAATLVKLGRALISEETAVLDPVTLEVRPDRQPDRQPVVEGPLEPRLLVFPRYVAEAAGVEVVKVSGGEAAYLVGTRSSRLGEVTGGPLHALARLARRVPAFHLRYDDPVLAAEEVLRLWPTP